MKLLIELILIYVFFSLKAKVECKLYPIAVRLPLNGSAPDLGGSLWPQPSEISSSLEFMIIDPDSFQIRLSQNLDVCQKDIIEKLWVRYKHILFPPKFAHEKASRSDIQLERLVFDLYDKSSINNVDSCSKTYYPFIQSVETEAYDLNVNSNEARVISKTVWGLIKGLESFSQLTYIFPDTNKVINF